MPVVPIDEDYTNIPQFVESLFNPDVRNVERIQKAIQGEKLTFEFSDQGEKILSVWLAAWEAGNNLPYNRTDFAHCPKADRIVLTFLSHFLARNRLCMYVPILKYVDPGSSPPVYKLSGYERYRFLKESKWDKDTIRFFLILFMLGAHFVFIEASIDLPVGIKVESYYELLRNSSDLAPYRGKDPGCSHYTSVLNLCGYYVPRIWRNYAPAKCPFLTAYLIGPTDSTITCRPKIYSTFMQLEGWQAITCRHNADYEIHKTTVWNISTYGASAYSEKRGTTIFLSPAQWVPAPNEDTLMSPYAGAETRQPWLRTDLIELG